ncbi:MAG: hypothetical protein PVF34_04275 [Gammaproteobacteria bacterium]|jgi:hypothetical protein
MDLKIIFGVAVFAIIALLIGLMLPGADQPVPQTYPWQIEVTADGTTKVFGLTLGATTLQQAERIFGEQAEISLFDPAADSSRKNIEAYFDKLILGGLSARMVLGFSFTSEQLQIMFERGRRISTLGDGSHKVTLHSEDISAVHREPIVSITYLSRITLDEASIKQRFGEPAQVIKESDSAMTHWLYPDKGLDVALDEKGNGVLQYVPPSQFSQLLKPLK